MDQLKCANGHKQIAEKFCTNQFCQSKRLYCFEECQKLQSLHQGHSKDTNKIEMLWSYVNDISEQCQDLINELEFQFQKVKEVYEQFKNNLLSKYSLSENIFTQLNSNQLNDALCNLVVFQDEKNKIEKEFKQITYQFIQRLDDCTEAFQIHPIDYFQINSNPFSYVLMQENKHIQKKGCYSFAFNNDSSVIFVGLYDGEIQIFEFQNEQMKLKKEIKIHTDIIYSLQYMEKSNKLVSGGADRQVIIWSTNDQKEWVNSQILIGHNGIIMCLIIDRDENIISSGNTFIKIWGRLNNYTCIQELNENQGDISSISLNPSQDIMISCMEQQDQITVYLKKLKEWKFNQNIKIDCFGHRLCFINNRMFTFQPFRSQFMEIFEQNQNTKFFTKSNQIQVKTSRQCDTLFPQIFNRQKSILINKNGQFINIFRIMADYTLQAQESLDFLTELLYGTLSRDGKYLITWDDYTQQIQIRRLEEQQRID